jgi:cytochrome P450
MNGISPLSAATALDPYPYYARLVREHPFYYDGDLQMWIASSAQAVEAVLLHEDFRVRPLSEPVPAQIAGTACGDLFGRFMRMTDGSYHAQLKHAALRAFGAFASNGVADWAKACAVAFGQRTLAAYMFRFPAFAMARALGLDEKRAISAAGAARDFSASFSQESTRVLLEEIGFARGPLFEAFGEAAADLDREAIVANAAAFLIQSCEATAGLIGNALRALAADPQQKIETLVDCVARYDSPVQNTRRFAAGDVTLFDRIVRAGETVLVLVAAANRDPRSQRSYTFGVGKHACPGERVACALAAAALDVVLQRVDPAALRFIGYRASPNVRIPQFEPA